MAVGEERDVVSGFSLKPAGRVAAIPAGWPGASRNNHARARIFCIPPPRLVQAFRPHWIVEERSMEYRSLGREDASPLGEFFYSSDWLVFSSVFAYVLS
jgi:hypothetical protein